MYSKEAIMAFKINNVCAHSIERCTNNQEVGVISLLFKFELHFGSIFEDL